MLVVPYSVNQRFPSGPAVIPSGPELAVGIANSVIASVVGLIIPIASPPVLGEPEVAVGARRDRRSTSDCVVRMANSVDGVGRRIDLPI